MFKYLIKLTCILFVFSCAKDNLKNEANCSDPTNLIVDVENNNVDFRWNFSGSEVNSFLLEYGMAGFDLGEGIRLSGEFGEHEQYARIIQKGEYEVYIQSQCKNGENGNWVGPVSFSILNQGFVCQPPILDTLLVATDSIKFKWSSPQFTQIQGDFVLGLKGFQLYRDDAIIHLFHALHKYKLVSYKPSTEYDAYINFTCYQFGGEFISDFLGPISFTSPSIGGVSACNNPPVITLAENDGPNSIELNWDDSGAISWELEYGETGFSLDTGWRHSYTGNSVSISGNFAESTFYDFYLRAKCYDGYYSEWVGPITVLNE